MQIKAERLQNLLEKLKGKTILVFGDLMVDEFLYGTVSRISPEAPVPVLEYASHSFVLGAASNAAANICALGGQARLFGCIGDDLIGKQFLEKLQALGLKSDGIVIDPGRKTTLKTRIIAHTQQVVRIDKEDATPISNQVEKEIEKRLLPLIKKVDGVLISDYRKGVVTERLAQNIVKEANSFGKSIIVDTKDSIEHFKGATLFTPNVEEAKIFIGRYSADSSLPPQVAQEILAITKAKGVLITQAERGMTLFEANGTHFHIPALTTEVHDVTGAGDTVASTTALAISARISFKEAAILANFAAAVVVRKIGTALPSPKEILTLAKGQD